MKRPLVWLLPLLLLPVGLSLADWVGKDGYNTDQTFDAVDAAGNVLSKAAIVDATGSQALAVSPDGSLKTNVGGVTRPASQSGPWDISLASSLPTGSVTIGAVNQDTPPWDLNLTRLNDANVANGNPLAVRLITNSANVAPANTLPLTCVGGCTAPTTETAPATYAAGANFTVNAGSGDKTCVWGSASKLVRVKRFTLQAFQNPPDVISFLLLKRTTVDTGGTPTTLTATALDSTQSAATATAVRYAATAASVAQAGIYTAFPVNATTGISVAYRITWGIVSRGSKAVVLRGQNEGICLFSAASATGATLYSGWEWTEESL
jgi:hypothetical protein